MAFVMPNVQAQGREPLCGEASLWSEGLGVRMALAVSAPLVASEYTIARSGSLVVRRLASDRVL